MRTVIFDLDGTLADTSGDLIAAANACFRNLGHGDMLDPAADRYTAFRGAKAMLRLGLERAGRTGEALVEAQYPVLLACYARDIDRTTRLYPGCLSALCGLRDAGYRTGICTNKPQALAETLMRRLGARHLFDALVGADTLPVRKPDPAPYIEAVQRAGGDLSHSVLVGDTETDRDTAKAAGVPCILVNLGLEGAGVQGLEPEAVIPTYSELPSTIRRLIG